MIHGTLLHPRRSTVASTGQDHGLPAKSLRRRLHDRLLLLRLQARDVPNWWRHRPLVQGLDLPGDATLADLLDLMQERHHREVIVHLVPRSLICTKAGRDDARAAWVALDDHDLLLIDEASNFDTREHDVLHEIAHMLLKTDCALLAQRLHGFDSAAQQRIVNARPMVKARGDWLLAEERETELLATMMRRRLTPTNPSKPFEGTALLDARLKRMLGCDTEASPEAGRA
ncbi:hypothetical protein [Kineococcus sp. SYSU DK003]|uniref:hypothetical protein n=1 Tax=Kineococcus sp. SYSU DK003 TaxID=3383124 RepID=UPI003D7E9E75